MQILLVERVHAESTDDRKSLTSLIRQSIVRSVFCTSQNVYECALSLTENRPDALQTYLLPNKRILMKCLNKNSLFVEAARCVVFHISRI